jgi:inner membrane protein
MPTIFSHAIAATAMGHLFPERKLPKRFWGLTLICSMLPDADVIGFAFGVRYSHILGHRGFSHSLLFAVIVGCLVANLAFRDLPREFNKLALNIYFSLATASHTLLDALTDGGLGVGLFVPFSAKRFFFPFRPIEVSPIGTSFFSSRGLEVLASEIKWVWLPSVLIIAAVWIYRKSVKQQVDE